MWIKTSYRLNEHVSLLTTAVSSHLLIVDDYAALVDASISSVSERLIDEINAYLDEGVPLQYLLLTHAHFDHLGGIPAIRSIWPQAELVVSRECADILARGDHLEACYEQNKICAQAMNMEMAFDLETWSAFFKVDRIVGDGDSIMLGEEAEVKMIASPGHTPDSVCYLARPDGALVGGEALGAYNGRDKVYSCFTSSFHSYVASLDKLSGLDVSAICLPHNGVLTGDLARKYLIDVRVSAERLYKTIKDRLDQGEIIDEIFISMLPEWEEQNISPEGPFFQARRDTLMQMIKVVAEDK